MNLHKTFAVAVIAGVLGVQLAVILPPGGPAQEWYWPFLNYPMYYKAFYPGDVLREHELRVTRCDLPDPPVRVSARDLKMEQYRHWQMLDYVARAGLPPARAGEKVVPATVGEKNIQLLSHLVRSELPDRYCRLQLWERAYPLGEDGFGKFDAPWRMVRDWSLDPDSLRSGKDMTVGDPR